MSFPNLATKVNQLCGKIKNMNTNLSGARIVLGHGDGITGPPDIVVTDPGTGLPGTYIPFDTFRIQSGIIPVSDSSFRITKTGTYYFELRILANDAPSDLIIGIVKNEEPYVLGPGFPSFVSYFGYDPDVFKIYHSTLGDFQAGDTFQLLPLGQSNIIFTEDPLENQLEIIVYKV